MKLLKLNISNFGLFHNKKIEFSDGLNLIYGENESGKSTIHSFIKGILFGIDKKPGRPTFKDMYDKYQPWKTPGSYDGSLEFEVDKQNYHIYRNFNKDNKEMVVTHVDSGRQLDLSQIEFQELIRDINKTSYEGTISIDQLKSKTDEDLVYEVQNHITNLSMTKSLEIDVKKALENLQAKSKEYDIKSLDLDIQDLQKKIKEGNQQEHRLEIKTSQFVNIIEQENELIEEKTKLINNEFYSIDELNKLFIEFPVIKTKYGYYLDFQDQAEELKARTVAIQKEMDIDDEKNRQVNKERSKIKDRQEETYKKKSSRNFKIMIPFLIIGLIFALINYNKSEILFYIGISFIVTSIIFFAVLQKILDRHKVKSESELRNKYEDSLMHQANISQLKKELKEKQEKYIVIQEKAKLLESEILGYLKNFQHIYIDNQKKPIKLSDEVIGILDEYITDVKMKINHYEEFIKPRLSNLQIKKERLKWEIELLEEGEEELIENKEYYKELLEKRDLYKKEIQSINLAIKTIQALSADIHDSFGKELNILASNIIKDITKGKYQALNIDEKLKIKTEIGDKYQHLERLSTGTIDQFYLSLRIAIADLIYKKGKVPILLDDSFVNYDDGRLRLTLEMLSANKDRQIIIFTCQKREKEILDNIGSGYNYIKL